KLLNHMTNVSILVYLDILNRRRKILPTELHICDDESFRTTSFLVAKEFDCIMYREICENSTLTTTHTSANPDDLNLLLLFAFRRSTRTRNNMIRHRRNKATTLFLCDFDYFVLCHCSDPPSLSCSIFSITERYDENFPESRER